MDQIADADTVERPIKGVLREEIMEALIFLRIGKAPGPSEVYTEMILASGDDGIRVIMEFVGILFFRLEHYLSSKEFSSILPSGSQPGKIHGLTRVHKKAFLWDLLSQY